MKIEHKTTIILETEAEREHFRIAFLIANEIANEAARVEFPHGVVKLPILVKNGVDNVAALQAFRETTESVLYSL